MSRPPRRTPVVTVLVAGAGLSVAAGCGKEPPPVVNPPAPEPEVIANPPPPDPVPAPGLPAWDEVESGHPPGATNPPMPVLVVQEDGLRCWKEWTSPMAPRSDLLAHGGKVVSAEDGSTGTEILCPEKAAQVLAAAAEDEPEP